MAISDLPSPRFLLLYCCFFFIPIAAWPQVPSAQSRIVERVDESALVALRGNTHPLAQPQFDRGAAPPGLPMERMLLVLRRSDAQESALQALLDAQQDPNSPSFHQWLSPDQFGQQFGPSDQDIQTVSTWLQSHGFQVARIAKGRTVIEFSGTALEVEQAFHTEIHKYTVNGADHWANANDPQIPQALSPVIVGVNSMHNFLKTPAHHIGGVFSKSRLTGQVKSLQPGFTFQNSNICGGAGDCYFVGPYDFAKIYNVSLLWNASPAIDGTGQSIANIGRSDIVLQDVRDFRNLFGLPPKDPNFVIDGTDPGMVPGDKIEATLDVEWSGAVAKGATINLVISASTETTDGVDLSALYAVDNNTSPVINESFLQCELFLGTAGNTFEDGLREQASAQGITFITAAGDQGAAGCDFGNGNPPEPASHGLMVNGLSSSPHGVAVGGTDFQNFGPNITTSSLNLPSPYWSAANDTHQASVLGYIPESTWNSTCTNNIFVILQFGVTPQASCNNAQLLNVVDTEAAGGGRSNCVTSDGTTPASCSGGYPKPSWQSAPGVPADGARDIPDVSLFASPGFMNSAYIICEADQTQSKGSCGLTGYEYDFLAIGGTSASAPAFAGIMAMVNQYTQSAGQGNANYVLYKLVSSSTQTSANCNSSAIPGGACIFNDITSGTIATPCAVASLNCNLSSVADLYGVLSGFSASTGYDLATGLGSVNAYNLVHGWTSPGISTTTTLSLNNGQAVNITHGTSVSFNVAISPSAATGDVSLIGAPTAGKSIAMGEFTLQNGSATGTTASLAGGNSYQVKAHYSGDGTYASSDSAPVIVTVAPESSTTLITIPVFDPITGNETGDVPTSLVYGSPYILRVDVGKASEKVAFPMKPVCAPLTCPTGSVTLADSVSGGVSGEFPLNGEGYAEDLSTQIAGGAHQLTASYAGDNSYSPSSSTYNLTVTPAPTQMTAPFGFTSIPVIFGTSTNIAVSVSATGPFPGAAPTGTITFYDGGAPISGTVTYSAISGSAHSTPMLTGSVPDTFATTGLHQISAKYSGDANYAAATSALNVSVVFLTYATAIPNPSTIYQGQSASITVIVTGASKSPPMTGTFQFQGLANPVSGTPSTNSSGNQTLTAITSIAPQSSDQILITYSGDTNYEEAAVYTSVTVNIPDFSLNVPANPFTITAGQPGRIPVTVTPATNLATTVSVSCGGNLPAGYGCGMLPGMVNLDSGASATVTLSLTPTVIGASIAPAPADEGAKHMFVPAFHRVANTKISVSCTQAVILLSWFLLPFVRRRARGRLALLCTVWLAIGCGSGSAGEGGAGGGGQTPSPQPTTTIITSSSSKVAAQTSVIFTATVSGSNNPTGPVLFYLNGTASGTANLTGNVATLATQIANPGIYVLTAQYSGDMRNSPSASGGLTQVVTGTTVVSVTGQTSTLVHVATVTTAIQ